MTFPAGTYLFGDLEFILHQKDANSLRREPTVMSNRSKQFNCTLQCDSNLEEFPIKRNFDIVPATEELLALNSTIETPLAKIRFHSGFKVVDVAGEIHIIGDDRRESFTVDTNPRYDYAEDEDLFGSGDWSF